MKQGRDWSESDRMIDEMVDEMLFWELWNALAPVPEEDA